MHWDHVHWAMAMGGIVGDRVAEPLKPLLGAPNTADADLDAVPFGVYDQGGTLPVGLSVAYNGTGRSEPSAATAGHCGGDTVTLNVEGQAFSATSDARPMCIHARAASSPARAPGRSPDGMNRTADTLDRTT